VFVEPQDYDDYTKVTEEHNIECLSANNQGMAFALNSIKNHCGLRGIDYIWKMDDDIRHLYDSTIVKSKWLQGGMIDDFIATTFSTLKDIYRFAGISIPNKFFHKDFRQITHVNKAFETTYIVKTSEWYIPMPMGGHNEEPIASAALVFNGLMTVRTGKIAWDGNMSSLEGGFQEYTPGDTRCVAQEKAFNWLKKNNPFVYKLIQPVDYQQKDGRMFKVVDKRVFNRTHSLKLPLKTDKNVQPYVLEFIERLKREGMVHA
jgi:hypothetical protein